MLDRSRIVGFAGIALLIAGVFAPLAYSPLGSITDYGGGHGDGIFVIALALIAAGLLYSRRHKLVLVMAALVAALCIFTFFDVQDRLAALRDGIDSAAAALVAGGEMGPSGLDWGWAPLALGTLCLAASGVMGWRRAAA
jgi:hypothetical protein